MFISEFNTRNFSFLSLGYTEQSSIDAMMAGLRTHDKQYHCELSKDVTNGDINTFPLQPGQALRDGEQLVIRDIQAATVFVPVDEKGKPLRLCAFPIRGLGDILACAKQVLDDPDTIGELQEAILTYWPEGAYSPVTPEKVVIDGQSEFQTLTGKSTPDEETDTGEIENTLVETAANLDIQMVERLRLAGLHDDADNILKLLKLSAAREYSLCQ